MREAWALVRRAVLFELRLYWSLLRWVARRPDRGGPEDVPVGYARLVTPVMWLWIFASALEVPLVHVLLPWEGVRLAVLALSLWGLLWMVGLLAALHVYPHLLGPEGVRIRNGPSTSVPLPWAAVAEVRVDDRELPSTVRTLQRRQGERGTELHVTVSGRTNVTASLHRPTVLHTRKGPVEAVSVSLLVDEPRAFVEQARRLATRAGDVRRPSPPARH